MSASTKITVHFVFTPKHRRPIFTGPVALDLDHWLRQVCQERNIIVNALAVEPDHVHLLVTLPPTLSISKAANYLKGVSSRRLRQAWPHLAELTALWGVRYWAHTVGGGAAAVKKYIQDQGF